MFSQNVYGENITDKSKKNIIKNFKITKYILTPPNIAFKRIQDSLNKIKNECCEVNFEKKVLLTEIKDDFEECINKKCQKYILPVYNPFKPPLKAKVLLQVDQVNDLLLDNLNLKYQNLLKISETDNEKDLYKIKEKNMKLRKTVNNMLKNYQEKISTLKEQNQILNDNFNNAYEMLSKSKQKKLKKVLK